MVLYFFQLEVYTLNERKKLGWEEVAIIVEATTNPIIYYYIQFLILNIQIMKILVFNIFIWHIASYIEDTNKKNWNFT